MRARWLSVGVTLLLLVVVAACGGEQEPAAGDQGDSGGGGGGRVKFGFLIGVTGDYSPYFEPSRIGAEIAIDEINQGGGVMDERVQLVTADNQSTVEGAVQGFSRLVDVDNVVAIGGVESDGALAILDSVKEQQIPTMCPACGTSELDRAAGDFIWRITGSDSDGGLIAAQFARDEGYEKVAMLVQKTEGASAPANVFKSTFEEKVGGTVTADVRFDPGKPTFQTELQQVYAGEPEAVYVGAGFEAGTVIFQEWERRGYGGNFFVSPDLVVPEISSLTPALQDGVARAAIPAYDQSSPAYESFAERYEAEAGEPPSAGLYEANQYDQYIALALAIVAADSLEGPDIAAAVPDVVNPGGKAVYSFEDGVKELEAGNEIDYHGASSSLDLNEFGNLASPVFGQQEISSAGEWEQVTTIELDPSLKQ